MTFIPDNTKTWISDILNKRFNTPYMPPQKIYENAIECFNIEKATKAYAYINFMTADSYNYFINKLKKSNGKLNLSSMTFWIKDLDYTQEEAIKPWLYFPLSTESFNVNLYDSYCEEANKNYEKIVGYRTVILSTELEPEKTIADISRMNHLFEHCNDSSECEINCSQCMFHNMLHTTENCSYILAQPDIQLDVKIEEEILRYKDEYTEEKANEYIRGIDKIENEFLCLHLVSRNLLSKDSLEKVYNLFLDKYFTSSVSNEYDGKRASIDQPFCGFFLSRYINVFPEEFKERFTEKARDILEKDLVKYKEIYPGGITSFDALHFPASRIYIGEELYKKYKEESKKFDYKY